MNDIQAQPTPIPEKRRVRRKDPRTSVEAARKAAAASVPAMEAVERLMMDGNPRIDEQIWADCRKNGYAKTLSTIQHARLALAECGMLIKTGNTFPTSNGSASEEWVMHDERWEQLEAEKNIKVQKPTKSGKVKKPNKDVLQAGVQHINEAIKVAPWVAGSEPLAVTLVMDWLKSLVPRQT